MTASFMAILTSVCSRWSAAHILNGVVALRGHTEFVLRVPDNIKAALVDPMVTRKEPEPVALASDGLDQPTLLVGAPSEQFSWVYAPGGRNPVELVPPVRDESFGTRVAVVKLASSFLFAVAAQPKATSGFSRSRRHRIRPGGLVAASVECRVSALAHRRSLNADDQDDLVSRRVNVSACDGSRLGARLTRGGLPLTRCEGPLLASLTWARRDVGDCALSDSARRGRSAT